MAKKNITIGFLLEIFSPYLLVGLIAFVHHFGYIRLPVSDQDRLTVLSAAISVGSILFGFSGVILVTVSTISGSRVIRDIRKRGGLAKLFYVVIESLAVNFLFVLLCIAGIFGIISIHWYQTIWLSFFALSVIKFFYSIIILLLLIWCQVDDTAPTEAATVNSAEGLIDPEDFKSNAG